MNIKNLKLGKTPATDDKRTIKLSAILDKTLPPVPTAYDFDAVHPGCGTQLFSNDILGDCVMASRGHLTQRMELIEQAKVISITDSEIQQEYFKESGGEDDGLNMLTSLKAWRKGWTAGGQSYTISAFARVSRNNQADVQQCIYLLSGCYVGVQLPVSAQAQMGKIWTVTKGPSARRGSWGGHAIDLVAYDSTGPICITWGARQQMTWAWLARYCDEAFGVVDDLDKWMVVPGIDVAKLKAYLKEIAA